METNRLDIVPGKIAPVIHTSQYDVGRTFRFYLYDGTSPFTLTGSETVTCSIRKTDGNIVILSVDNTADNYVDVVTTEQSTACAGQNICELRIEDGEVNIGTMDFILQVESDPTEGGIESATEINNLRTQVSEMVGEEVASQYDAEAVVFDNAPTEGHGIGFAVTSEGIKTAIKEATTPEGEVSGDIVTFDDALNGVPFIEVEAQIEATQSGTGTPSPDNIRPITAFSEVVVTNNGKNWINLPDEVRANHGVTYTVKNGVVSLSGTATSPYADYTFNFAGKRGTTYFLSGGVSADIYIRNTHYNKNDTGNGFSFVSDGESSTFYIRVLNGIDATGIVIKPQIEVGESKTAFEPFKGSTHTVDLGQTVGKGVLNVTTGVLTYTHKVIDLGSMSWTRYLAGSNYIFYGDIADGKPATVLDEPVYIKAEIFETIPKAMNATLFANEGNNIISKNLVNVCRIVVRCDTYTTAEEFKTAMNGIKLFYDLDTPVTVQLTPEEVKAISGLNTVAANSGDIRVVYRKDFGIVADSVPYDNRESGLTADNVQDAIDEVADTTYTKTETDALLADKADTADLATVATSGNYSDLTSKPTESNGVVTLGSIISAGYVTGSGNYVTCTIPLLNMATSATLTGVGTVNIFTPEGAVANAVQLEQSSVVSLNHHGITVEFRLKTAQTANRPCTVQVASGLTFTLS